MLSSLLTNLTGNSVVDSIVLSLTVAILPTIYSAVTVYISRIKQHFDNCVNIPNIDFGAYRTTSNDKYIAVLEWLNKNVKYVHGSVQVSGESLRPNGSSSHTFMYKGKRFRYWCTEKHLEKVTYTPFVYTIHISGRQLASIIEFVEEVTAAYQKSHTAKRKWVRLEQRWHSQLLPKRTFNQLALEESVKREIVRDMEMFTTSKDDYNRVGVPWKRGYLLYGPPGTGKTSTILAMADALERDVFNVNLNQMRNDEDLHSALASVPAKSIIVFEDIDCDGQLAHERQKKDKDKAKPKSEDEEVHEKVTLKALLNELDGINSNEERIVIITTNHKHLLDPALIRCGRVDKQYYLGYVTPAIINSMLKLFFDRVPTRCLEVKKEITPAQISGICLEEWSDFANAVRRIREVVC